MHIDGQHSIVDAPSDLVSWEILHVYSYTDSVRRLHLRKINSTESEFRIAYCSIAILKSYLESWKEQYEQLLRAIE